MAAPKWYPEFEITEAPHPRPPACGDTASSWRSTLLDLADLDRRLNDAREEIERERADGDARRRLLFLALIEDVKDNLDRSLEGIQEHQLDPAAARWFRKLRRMHRAVEELLARERVIQVTYERFVPQLMVVGGVRPRDDVPEGTVLEVVRCGYLWQGEVLRKAEVIVAAASAGRDA